MDRETSLIAGVGVALLAVVCLVVGSLEGVAIAHKPVEEITIPLADSPPSEDFKSGATAAKIVNIKARDEVKQQGAVALKPCIAAHNQQYQRPQVGFGAPPLGAAPIYPYAQVQIAQVAQRPPVVLSSNPVVQDQRKPASKHQLAIFIDSSERSKKLAEWFETYPPLVKLRNECQFQAYTSSSPMYRERFSDIVPTDAFPAVMFLRPDGGHIHIAGGDDIPPTAEQLYSDLAQGWQYAKEIKDRALQAKDDDSPLPDDDEASDDREPRRPLLRPLRRPEKDKEGIVWDFMWGGKEIQAALYVLAGMGVACIIALLIRARR